MKTLTINTNINVEIDLSTDLSDKEKQGLINELYEQGFMPYDIKPDYLNSDLANCNIMHDSCICLHNLFVV